MSEVSFRRGVRSAVRGLWSGGLSRSQFNSSLSTVIKGELTSAFAEGARECGITAEELTEDELKARDAFIKEQQSFVPNFGGDIRGVDKLNKGKLQPLFERAEMWVNRWNDAKERAKSLACGNQKLEWEVGPTEHCKDCSGYNGKVYRASVWGEIRPQSSCLECGGFRCQCKRKVTTKRASRGTPAPMSKC
jgi:hypothetical protein